MLREIVSEGTLPVDYTCICEAADDAIVGRIAGAVDG
jgi:hypothetical protein